MDFGFIESTEKLITLKLTLFYHADNVQSCQERSLTYTGLVGEVYRVERSMTSMGRYVQSRQRPVWVQHRNSPRPFQVETGLDFEV